MPIYTLEETEYCQFRIPSWTPGNAGNPTSLINNDPTDPTNKDTVWVENYTHIASSEQPSWAVFRDDGRYLGVVETPMSAQVTHIGDDFVLVLSQDELEVQRVQMYELIKP